ncbi:hypothetical protein K227x_50860 [Rubripirellula lacrimiformis]|uniref:Uncharacterized protein n=1 Tax=Rubripirellula lacrimiformis TaxID=1930273 RepID=A0A517NHR3_9BACT|nr:hypothetical protein [Rubripirellula lacrimiformis]QDT06670.1 hypothetical protein K227x_50860 [Rubripirellula lacrimiformis]
MSIKILDRRNLPVHRTARVNSLWSRPGLARTVCLLAIGIGCVGGIGATPGVAQQDPFGSPAMDGGGLFADPGNAAKPSDDDDILAEDPVKKQLLEQARRGDEQLAASIASLARTGRWAEVDELLKSISNRKYSQAAAASMATQIGPAVFFQIKQQADVSDEAKASLDRLGAALIAQNTGADRLVQAIKRLDSPSKDQRLAAARVLLHGGEAAIGQLAAAAVAERSAESRSRILQTMSRLGDGGMDALQQLAAYGTADVRSRAIESLSQWDADANIVFFAVALHAIDSTDQERQAATAAFAKLNSGIPSVDLAIQIAYRDLQDQAASATATDNDDATTTIWTIKPERTGVTAQTSRTMLAAYRDAADAALRLRRMDIASAANAPWIQADILSSSLAYRVLIDPDWGDPEQIEEVLQLVGGVDESIILTAIQRAAGQELAATGGTDPHAPNARKGIETAAMIGLIRLAGSPHSQLQPDRLLRSNGGRPSILVQQASSSTPLIRYEAAQLVSELADGSAYPGSSRVQRTLVEMTRLGDRPSAIIVETRPNYIAHFERLIDSMGWTPVTVGSVGALQRAIDQGGDLRMILSKTLLSDMSPIEMVDVVRRASNGGEVPLLFFDDQGSSVQDMGVTLGQSRWSAPMALIDAPVSVQAFDGILTDVQMKRRLPALSVLDRQRFRVVAQKRLASGENE